MLFVDQKVTKKVSPISNANPNPIHQYSSIIYVICFFVTIILNERLQPYE